MMSRYSEHLQSVPQLLFRPLEDGAGFPQSRHLSLSAGHEWLLHTNILDSSLEAINPVSLDDSFQGTGASAHLGHSQTERIYRSESLETSAMFDIPPFVLTSILPPMLTELALDMFS